MYVQSNGLVTTCVFCMSPPAIFAVAKTGRDRYFLSSEKEREMEKLRIITKEILALNFRQAYEVFHCKCNCWETRHQNGGEL